VYESADDESLHSKTIADRLPEDDVNVEDVQQVLIEMIDNGEVQSNPVWEYRLATKLTDDRNS
jgi:hypothetical protein